LAFPADEHGALRPELHNLVLGRSAPKSFGEISDWGCWWQLCAIL
jgi:hypothetical protein